MNKKNQISKYPNVKIVFAKWKKPFGELIRRTKSSYDFPLGCEPPIITKSHACKNKMKNTTAKIINKTTTIGIRNNALRNT